MIVDNITAYFRSGSGGEGSNFSRKLSSRKITGAGGDGGKGGDVVLKVSEHLFDLSKFKSSKKFIAGDGERGKEGNKKGRDVKDLVLEVPSGTRVIENDQVIFDLVGKAGEFSVCSGGKGGKGNYRRDYTVPAQGYQERILTLDYRIPNEVAILGFPNSGKSTLFNILTGQYSKVAEYPFTTASCLWGESEYNFIKFKVLDTPPLKRKKNIEENSNHSFLRHIFRSRIILILIDVSGDYKVDFLALNKEILSQNISLITEKKFFYLLNKVDKIDKKKIKELKVEAIALEGSNVDFFAVSNKPSQGINELKKKIADLLDDKNTNQ